MKRLLRWRGLHPLIGKSFCGQRYLLGTQQTPFFCVNRSRIWVAEEGEVFRKGTVLLGPAEMEGEYAGEELRKEVSKILTKLKRANSE